MKPWQNIAVGFLASLILLGLGLLFFLPYYGETIALVTLTPNLTPAPSPTVQMVSVHVLGAVSAPGVYSFPQGARVIDALNAAGAIQSQADLSRLNLSAVLEDGQRLYVPFLPTPTAPGDPGRSVEIPADGLININTATAEELEQLPQIGSAKAEAIVAYRAEHGPFLSLDELNEVTGIGEAIIEVIKDLVTLGP